MCRPERAGTSGASPFASVASFLRVKTVTSAVSVPS